MKRWNDGTWHQKPAEIVEYPGNEGHKTFESRGSQGPKVWETDTLAKGEKNTKVLPNRMKRDSDIARIRQCLREASKNQMIDVLNPREEEAQTQVMSHGEVED